MWVKQFLCTYSALQKSFLSPLLILNFTWVFPTADFIPETIKQMLFTFLKVGLMKDELTAYKRYFSMFPCLLYLCQRYLFFSCEFGILLVC